jgi:hypothetical protein
MSLAWNLENRYVNLGDSAELNAYVYDDFDAPVPQDQLASVSYTIQDPAGAQVTQAGSIIDDGVGFTRYTSTATVGAYKAIATFIYASGQVKSVRTNFEVIDPFNPPAPTNDQVIAELTWRKIEDCFDAEDEGPWLRDMTLNFFNKDKMPEFVAEALFDINQQNPPTSLNEGYFITGGQPNVNMPLLIQGTFLAVILHLVTSYVEQPQAVGGQVIYEDRRDYMTRWLQIYEVEMQRYMRWVALFKRQFLGLGHSKGLISNKAGRLTGAPMRSTTIGRGY